MQELTGSLHMYYLSTQLSPKLKKIHISRKLNMEKIYYEHC